MPTMSARSQLRCLLACALGVLVLGLLAGLRPDRALYVAVVLAGPLSLVVILGADDRAVPVVRRREGRRR